MHSWWMALSLPCSHAFVAPRSAYYPPPIPNRRTGRSTLVVVSDPWGIATTTSTSEQDSTVTLFSSTAETETASPPATSNPKSSSLLSARTNGDDDKSATGVDLGKAIFLANAEGQAELLAILEDPSEASTQRRDHDGAAMDVTLVEQGSTSINSRLQQNDTVRAILAASEEAVAKAEASLLSQSSSERDTLLVPSSVQAPREKPFTPPGVGKILKFAIPAIGVWLCSPMLSLIDTSAVGILSGTIQQAALSPAVAITDYSALMLAFLYTGATNLIAAAREHDDGVVGAPRTRSTMIGAMQLSVWVGLGLGLTLLALSKVLLRTIIGNDGMSPAVVDAAIKYVRIRALGMPAAALIGTAQASCLGMQDIRSPLYVLLAAAVVNFLGDMCFVGCAHPWIGGAAGAAWATVISQYAAVGLFVHWMRHKKVDEKKTTTLAVNDGPSQLMETTTVDLSDAILELTTGKSSNKKLSRRRRLVHAVKSIGSGGGSSKTSPPKEESFSVRGFLDGHLQGKRELVKLPPRSTIQAFSPYVLPVTSTTMGRVSGYVAMSHVVSSSMGTVSMAAQQVIVSLFYCLCPVADSLSLTAQSFLPAISEKKPSPARSKALRQTILNFMKAGSIAGAFLLAVVACIPLLSGFFTSDPMVSALVNLVTPLLLGFFSVHGICMGVEGLLLGQKDLGFLGGMYGGFFFVIPFLMMRVKRAVLSGASNIDLTSVWKIFLGYQMFRTAAWVARVAFIQKRTERITQVVPPATP